MSRRSASPSVVCPSSLYTPSSWCGFPRLLPPIVSLMCFLAAFAWSPSRLSPLTPSPLPHASIPLPPAYSRSSAPLPIARGFAEPIPALLPCAPPYTLLVCLRAPCSGGRLRLSACPLHSPLRVPTHLPYLPCRLHIYSCCSPIPPPLSPRLEVVHAHKFAL